MLPFAIISTVAWCRAHRDLRHPTQFTFCFLIYRRYKLDTFNNELQRTCVEKPRTVCLAIMSSDVFLCFGLLRSLPHPTPTGRGTKMGYESNLQILETTSGHTKHYLTYTNICRNSHTSRQTEHRSPKNENTERTSNM